MTLVVASDRAFQRVFTAFYRVWRSGDWRAALFENLERAKASPICFGDALHQLREATGRVEASFASKLVATVDPDLPVIDSVGRGQSWAQGAESA